MNWFESPLKNRLAVVWLIILLISTLIFLWATTREPMNINSNIASFFATMMGAGASGLVTFYLVDRESKRRQDLNVLWLHKSILDIAFLLATDVNFYNSKGFKLLKFEDEYPFKKYMLELVVAKTTERSLNHAFDISKILNELCSRLKYINYRLDSRQKLNQMGVQIDDSGKLSELSRSTLNDIYPIIAEFASEVINPGLKDVEDIKIRDAMFALKENYNSFVMMYHHPQWQLGSDFNQNLLNYFVDFINLYNSFIEKYPINLKLIKTDVSVSKNGTEVKFKLGM